MPPSKGKKASKPSSTPSPSTPVRRGEAAVAGSGEDEELRLKSLLSAAAAKFPSLVAETAFIGKISDVDSSSQYKGGEARVWLSEAAMVSSSLRPGSLVSVSLAASDHIQPDGSPLNAFSDECERYFGIDGVPRLSSEMGNYFAIATVFPSRKVLKNGVRLSWCLSCTMGFPASGRGIFVFPINIPSKNYSGNDRSKNSIDKNSYQISLCKCENLYLKLVPANTALIDHRQRVPSRGSTESGHIFTPNGKTSSPRTPACYQPEISSPTYNPVLSNRGKESIPSADTGLDISAIRIALEDEKINEMLKIFAARWLYGRYILAGNFVTLPICGKFYVFLVESADKSMDGSTQDLTSERHTSRFLPETQISNSLELKDIIFMVDYKTKAYLFGSTPLTTAYLGMENLKPDQSSKNDFKKNMIITVPKLGGLSKEFGILKEIIKFSLMHKESLPRYKGVLLHGPPGTGKTSLASSCARDAGAKLFSVNGPEVVSQYYGESEQALCEVFEYARQASPAVVFIDELDAIAPARKEGGEELSLRIVATLLTLMDGINETDGVLVIAATNRPDCIDPALRRPGRLDREIEIGVPSPDQRLEILTTLLDRMHHSLNKVEIRSLALATHGFVGADLAAFCNEAAMVALRRYIISRTSGKLMPDQDYEDQFSEIGGTPMAPKNNGWCYEDQVDCVSLSLSKMAVSSKPCEKILEIDNNMHSQDFPQLHDSGEESVLKLTTEDFEKAKLKVRPSAMREVMLEFPKVSWEDVGGQTEIKKQLIEAVQLPQICPDAFKRIGIRPPKGLLMFGPPGCSKTLIARAVASEAKLNFLAVKGPELFSKWVGESEKAVKSLFAKARANSPSIIFFDEIDGLAITRGQDNDGTSVADRVLSQLLVELDGLDQRSGVTVIAATNRPDKIDPALLRPGRFDRHLDVKPPNESEREAIFHIHMRGMPCGSDVTARELAHLTEVYTGADIKLICREAAIAALEESFETREISMEHFKVGIGRVKPSDVQFYLTIAEKFKRYVDSKHPGGQ